MNVSLYFGSLSQEVAALKDRIRYLINDQHWQTDGEWKESVLRSILRRHLPSSFEIGSGFLIAPGSSSKQIDVLVYDSSSPVLFRDGDLVFLASAAARVIVEVKAKIHSTSHLTEVLQKLADKSEFLYQQTPGDHFQARPPYIGLFAYEWDGRDAPAVLNALAKAASIDRNRNPHARVVTHVALGPSFFVRYWERDPSGDRGANYSRWHAYHFDDQAFGHFIHTILHSISPEALGLNPDLWYPAGGKGSAFATKGLYEGKEQKRPKRADAREGAADQTPG
jgi:hypothetical protein